MTDVCLVQMPYSLVNRPSLGLSLVQAYLEEAGLDVDVIYANLLFADDIGFDVYRVIEESSPHDLLGEWTFSEAAFGAGWSDTEAYFKLVAGVFRGPHANVLRGYHPDVDLEDLFLLVRERATAFVGRLAQRIVDSSARIVGCTSMFQQQVGSLALLRKVRDLNPDAITMLGGANCEGPMGRATIDLFPWIDYVSSGEADSYIGPFCKRILEEGQPTRAEDLPHGLFGRSKRLNHGAYAPLGTGRRSALPPRPSEGEDEPKIAPRAVVQNLDDTAIPSFDDFFESFERASFSDYVTTTLPIETARGCWWGQAHHCTFCGLSDIGITFRSKTPDRVIDEMRHLAERHSMRRFETADEILDMTFLKTVLPRLAEEEEVYTLFYEVKSNLKRDQLEILAKAGVREVQPGIESLHDKALAHFDKGNTGLMNIEFLKWTAELGIRVGWNFLYGAPGEEDSWYEEIAERVPLLHHLQPPGCSSRVGYHRFSPYHDDPERFGIRLDPRRAYFHIYPLKSEDLEQLAYYFEDYSDYFRGNIDPTLPGQRRPGLEAAVAAFNAWREAFYVADGNTPQLLAEATADGLLVRDTRSVATAAEHVLDSRTTSVLNHCRNATTRPTLLRKLGAEPAEPVEPAGLAEPGDFSATELDAILADLRARRLIVEDGERALSLVLEQVLPVPSHLDSASGAIRIVDFTRDFADKSLARDCVRQPNKVTIRELFSAR